MGEGCPGREIFKGGLRRRCADVPWGRMDRSCVRLKDLDHPRPSLRPSLGAFPIFFFYIFRDYATRSKPAESRAWTFHKSNFRSRSFWLEEAICTKPRPYSFRAAS